MIKKFKEIIRGLAVITSIKRLDIKPGEILIATMPKNKSVNESVKIAAVLKELVPGGVKIGIMHDDITFAVIHDTRDSKMFDAALGKETSPRQTVHRDVPHQPGRFNA